MQVEYSFAHDGLEKTYHSLIEGVGIQLPKIATALVANISAEVIQIDAAGAELFAGAFDDLNSCYPMVEHFFIVGPTIYLKVDTLETPHAIEIFETLTLRDKLCILKFLEQILKGFALFDNTESSKVPGIYLEKIKPISLREFRLLHCLGE
jgi:hypothetical protein